MHYTCTYVKGTLRTRNIGPVPMCVCFSQTGFENNIEGESAEREKKNEAKKTNEMLSDQLKLDWIMLQNLAAVCLGMLF